jgi:hypothetical protein
MGRRLMARKGRKRTLANWRTRPYSAGGAGDFRNPKAPWRALIPRRRGGARRAAHTKTNPKTKGETMAHQHDLTRETEKLERLGGLDPEAMDLAGKAAAFELLHKMATSQEFPLGLLRRQDDPGVVVVEFDDLNPHRPVELSDGSFATRAVLSDQFVISCRFYVASAVVERLREVGEVQIESLDEALADD